MARKREPEGRRNALEEITGKAGKLFERLPPHSLESEMSLLGAMILDHTVIADVLSIVKSRDDFYSEAHGTIFEALVTIADKHQSGDLVQLNEYLRDKGGLKSVGGGDYLVELAHSVPSSANAPHYARTVADRAKLRKLISLSGQIMWDCYHHGELDGGAQEALQVAESKVFELAQEREVAESADFGALLDQEVMRIEQAEGRSVSGLRTGYHDLDNLLSGLQPSEMVVIAARPSMGKTALALNIAEQVARGGRGPDEYGTDDPIPVALFSLEMSRSAIAHRLLSAVTGIESHKLRSGMVGKDSVALLKREATKLKALPMYVDDSPALDVIQLRSRARRMQQRHGIKLVVIDYLQLLNAIAYSRESRQVEVSAISRNIKALARELKVPVIVLSQLNRDSEKNNRRPRMSDLRESGAIEQDADVIMLLHREEYYATGDPAWKEENPDKVGLAELIVAKQRNGPTGVVKLTWADDITRFRNHGGAGGQPYLAPSTHWRPMAPTPVASAKSPLGPERPDPEPEMEVEVEVEVEPQEEPEP